MEVTQRLALPMIAPGQAQKELWHNEALNRLDLVVSGAVEEAPGNDPPAVPVAGSCYLVGEDPTGAWTNHAHHLAAFSSAGWRFVAPAAGLTVLLKTTGTTAVFMPGGWELGTTRASKLVIDGKQVVGPQVSAIAHPAGGAVIDVEARAALVAMLSAMRQHGLIASE